MNNLKETIQANLVGKEVNQTTILKAIKSAYRNLNFFETEEEAILYMVSTYDTDPSKVLELNHYVCELEGRPLDDQSLVVDGAEANYTSTFKVSLTSYSHDPGMDEEDYAFVITINEL